MTNTNTIPANKIKTAILEGDAFIAKEQSRSESLRPQVSSIHSASPFAKARFSEIARSVKAGIIHFKNKNDTEKI